MNLGERLFRNEEVMRLLNFDIAGKAENIGPVPSDYPLHLHCECGDDECWETIEITLHDYRAIHNEPHAFIVKHGHLYPRFEEVGRETEQYCVIHKIENRLPRDMRIN